MCKDSSRLRKQFMSPRNNPARQLLATLTPIQEIKRLGVTRTEGDKRYTRPPDVTRIIDSYPATHDPVTLAGGSDPALALAGQQLDLDLSGYATVGSVITDHGGLSGLGDDDHAQYVLRSILTTKGDIFARTASAISRLPVGSDGQVMTADSAQTLGVKWATPSSGAPTDAQYLTLATNATLSNERVMTAGAGLTGTDAGANSTYTLALATPGTLTASTSNSSSSNHTHAITASENPGTAASLLKTSAAGLLTLEKLYVGDSGGDSNFDANVNMQAIDTSIGISSSGGNATVDVIAYGGFSSFRARRAGGTRGSESNVSADTEIARYGGAGYGSGFPAADMSYMSSYTSQSQTGSNKGHDLRFFTTPDNSTATVERGRISNDGNFILGDTANANMSRGVTVNQSSFDDEIIALKSSDVAHGMTSVTETDTFGLAAKSDAVNGGLWWAGLSDAGDGPALRLAGYNGANLSTAKGTGARGAVIVDAAIKSGSGIGAVNANGNLLVVRDNFLTRAIIDAEGELHLDATSAENAWDDHDDLDLLKGLRAAVLSPENEVQQRLARFLADARPILERTGVATFNEDGSVFVAMKALQMLVIDAMRQMYERLDGRLSAIEAVAHV